MSRRDRRIVEIEQYWSVAARIVRALQRFDGPAIPADIFTACDIGEEDLRTRNTYQKSLERLVARGVALRDDSERRKQMRFGTGGFGYGSRYTIAPRYIRARTIRLADRLPRYRVAM